MRNFTAIDMLTVWEQGLNQNQLYRGLLLLIAAYPELDSNDIAEWSIGKRDQHLLQLRKRLFGPTLVNSSVCPECSERIEWQNNVDDILIVNEALSDSDFDLEVDTHKVRFRLPNSLDIAAVLRTSDIDKAQTELLKRCILQFSSKGKQRATAELPEKVIAALSKRIEVLDQQADIVIDLGCPVCTHKWGVVFDVSRFLWTELNDWAERTLRMIHVLASAYGWSEREILMLSPIRRQLYLGMLRP